MARILVCGTLAYDDIGAFDSPFHADTRNVKLNSLHRGFGGCAMNIAYNLAGLGHRPVPFVYAGDDYSGDYARHVAAAGISEAGIFRISGTPSARGIVLTGCDGVQFTAFYPGPSGLDRCARDLEAVLADEAFDAAIVAPDLPEKMALCAARLDAVALRLWCPGQYAELLSAAQIEPMLTHCDVLVANAHEWQALCRHVDPDRLLSGRVRAIVTHGADPVELLPAGPLAAASLTSTRIPVPPLAPDARVDPTGCGDAFVAALVSELIAGTTPESAIAAGIRLAGRCMRWRGAQYHPVRAAPLNW